MAERDYAREYGSRCRQIRMAKGISQQQLADMMNVTPQAVSKWEKDGVTNVNTVQQLSNSLGQDITADQIDQEGAVGEIGKEILSILVRNNGYSEYRVILNGLYGLSEDRVNNEIFKLERIGAVIREQYKDFYDSEIDGVMITAKGLIAYKHTNELLANNMLGNVCTIDVLLKAGQNSIQEYIDENEAGKLVWNLITDTVYRLDYIYYLRKNFTTFLPGMEAYRREDILEDMDSLKMDEYITGESCFVDLLMRMVKDYDDESLKDVIEDSCVDEYIENNTYYNILGGDIHSINAYRVLSGRFDSLRDEDDIVKDIINGPDEQDDLSDEYKVYEEQYQEYLEKRSGQRFFKNLSQEKRCKCEDWFSKKEILNYIKSGYSLSVDPETDHDKKLEEDIQRIWALNPETLEYYYQFPEKWEKNGVAQAIRDKLGVPAMPEP